MNMEYQIFQEKNIISLKSKDFRFLNGNTISYPLVNLESQNSIKATEFNLISIPHSWIGGIFTSIGLYALSLVLTLLVLIFHRKTVSKTKRDYLIYILMSLSIGTLIGDSVIHLLPECYGIEEEEKEEGGESFEPKIKPNKNLISLFIILGFIVIYLFEKVLLLCGIGHSHGIEDHNHSHSIIIEKKIKIEKKENSNDFKNEIENEQSKRKEFEKCAPEIHENRLTKENKIDMYEIENKRFDSNNIVLINNNNYQDDFDKNQNISEPKVIEMNKIDSNYTEKNHDEKENDIVQAPKKKCCDFLTLKGTKSVGILVVFSEIIHNLIDGIAIGVVFSSRNRITIISTIIAIILHEIPKELADAGVLLHSNFGFWPILFWNSISNIGGIIGSFIGLGISEMNEESKSYVLSFTAGNFLYISLAQLIPILVHVRGKLINFLIFVGIIIGIGIMYSILFFE